MEEKKEVTHSLHLEQRGHGLVTGVTEMKSFDEENIFMETSQGTLAIRGSSLHVCRLELEKGEAEIEGKVDSLIYTQGRKEKKKSLRLFISRAISFLISSSLCALFFRCSSIDFVCALVIDTYASVNLTTISSVVPP